MNKIKYNDPCINVPILKKSGTLINDPRINKCPYK